jgi:predicted aldo/keto reductase-like oxidoreductase
MKQIVIRVVEAATEVAHAFNDERERQTDEVSKAYTAPFVIKVWDATLDKRTCNVCARRDGTLQFIGLSFHDDGPGKVHPNCRCVSVLWPMRVLNTPIF